MRRGFGLLNVLIIVLVVVVLAAVLIPVYQKSRKKERACSCHANIRQICAGILAYAEDYDGYLPQAGRWQDPLPHKGSGLPNFIHWTESIAPYLKNIQVLHCPDSVNQPDPLRHNYGLVVQVVGCRNFRPGFSTDRFVCGSGTAPRRLSDVPSPEKRIMVGDASDYRIDVRYWNATTNPHPSSPGGAWCRMVGRHEDRAECGFVDGHAKPLRMTSPFGLKWPNVCAGPIEYYSTE